MAIYRNVQLSFWSDTKVVDDFSVEDRYFFLYLMTNPHTVLSGCYELSLKQAADETGLSRQKIAELIKHLRDEHGVIDYDTATKEVLIINWAKYNWTKSDSVVSAVKREAADIKTERFRKYILNKIDDFGTVYHPVDTVGTGCPQGGGATVTVTDTVSDSITDPVTDPKDEKHNTAREEIPYFGDPVLDKEFHDWLAMRAKLKKPATERAIQLSMKELEKLATGPGGFDPDLATAIVDQSIMRSWIGLFPLKDDYSARAPTRGRQMDEWATAMKNLEDTG